MPVFTFKDIVKLDDRAIQKVMREVDSQELVKALISTDEAVQDKVFRNMPKYVRAMLKEDMEYMGKVRQKDIEEAQEKIFSIIYHLCDTGEIAFEGSFHFSDDDVHENEISEKQESKPLSPLEAMIKRIEDACTSGSLYICYDEEIVKSAFYAFQNRSDELARIRSLSIQYCGKLTELPLWIRELTSLSDLSVNYSEITSIPDWISDLQSLTELILHNNKNLNTLPESIGNLKNLAVLDIHYSPIEQLPNSIVNLTALQYINIFGTKIHSVPQSVSSVKEFINNTTNEIIPAGHSLSYREFVNSYYRLVKTISRFSNEARRHGLLAIEDDIEIYSDLFFGKGMRLVVDGTGAVTIRDILSLSIEREHDFYRKKLMEITMEGILNIQAGDSTYLIIMKLNSMIDIKDNLLDTACAQFFVTGNPNILLNFDFYSAIQTEGEREEISFIKRAVAVSEKVRREGLLALEKDLDYEAIVARDVFEYGISLAIGGDEHELIGEILTHLIAHEIDPVQKNLAQAKKDAVLSISAGDNTRILIMKLLAYFDKSITKTLEEELLRD